MQNVILYIFLIAACSPNFIAVKYQISTVSPEASIAYRFFIASLVVGFLMLIRNARQRLTLRDHGLLFLQAVCFFSIHLIIIYYGSFFLTSGLVGIGFSSMVFFSILNGKLFLSNKLERTTIIGSTLGIVGISMVFAKELAVVDDVFHFIKGFSIVLLGAYVCSLGGIVSSKVKENGVSLLQANSYAMFYGALICLVCNALMGKEFSFDMTVPYVASLLHLGLVGTGIGFSLYVLLLRRIGPEKTGYSMVITPIVALFISSFIEGYEWTIASIMGVGVILLGNVLVLSDFKKSSLFQRLNLLLGDLFDGFGVKKPS